MLTARYSVPTTASVLLGFIASVAMAYFGLLALCGVLVVVGLASLGAALLGGLARAVRWVATQWHEATGYASMQRRWERRLEAEAEAERAQVAEETASGLRADCDGMALECAALRGALALAETDLDNMNAYASQVERERDDAIAIATASAEQVVTLTAACHALVTALEEAAASGETVPTTPPVQSVEVLAVYTPDTIAPCPECVQGDEGGMLYPVAPSPVDEVCTVAACSPVDHAETDDASLPVWSLSSVHTDLWVCGAWSVQKDGKGKWSLHHERDGKVGTFRTKKAAQATIA